MSTWNHIICSPCWTKRCAEEGTPDRKAVCIPDSPAQPCCFCGEDTTFGAFVRHDPKTLSCTHPGEPTFATPVWAQSKGKDCIHSGKFALTADVVALQETHEKVPHGYVAQIRMRCIDCGVDFCFLDLPAGAKVGRATCSFDRTEALLPITPFSPLTAAA